MDSLAAKCWKRLGLAAGVAAVIVLVLVIIVLAIEPAPVGVSFDSYERSGSSNYAILVITNSSDRTFSFTSHNTFPEGTARHFVSFRDANGWGEPFENNPSIGGRGTLFRFAMVLPPRTARSVKVPVDDVPRRVGVPVYLSDMHEGKTSRLKEWRAKLRNHVRRILRLDNSPNVLIWCDAELQALRKD